MKNDGNEKLGLWDKVKALAGYKQAPNLSPLPAHHQKVWDAKGEIEKLDNGVPAHYVRPVENRHKQDNSLASQTPTASRYTSAISHTGSLYHTSSGKTESISRVGEANRMFKAINKENELSMKI